MKLVLAALIGAVIQMIWGFFVWGLASEALGIVTPLPGEAEIRPALQQAATESGVYFVPSEGMGSEDWQRRHDEGPVAWIFLNPTGFPSNMPRVMLLGFLHMFATALLLGWILKLAGPPPTFIGRMKVVGWVAFFAAFAIYVSHAIWWYAPAKFTIFALIAVTAGWKLSGAAMAAMIKPAT